MLRRWHFHIDDGYLCVMCNTRIEEDIHHLLFYCPFAVTCWQAIQFDWPDINDIHTKLSYDRANNAQGFFMEIFLVAAWELWNLQNDKIFNNAVVSRRQWISILQV